MVPLTITIWQHSSSIASSRLTSQLRQVNPRDRWLRLVLINITQVPRSLSLDQASTIACGIGTAAIGMYGTINGIGLIPPWDRGGWSKYKGWPILILGGAGSVGNYGKLGNSLPQQVILLKHNCY
jgi:hypothetical protein